MPVAGMARDDDDTAPMLASDDFAWQKLPPLPAPKAHRRQEALCGTLVVLGIIVGCVSCTRKGTQLMLGGAEPPSPARVLAALNDSVAASASAACHTADVAKSSISFVLLALEVPTEFAVGTLRLSVGRHTTPADIERAAGLILDAAKAQQ